MKPIFTTRWETDSYKFSMGQVFWQRFRGTKTRYTFTDRDNLPYINGLMEGVKDELEAFASLPSDIDRARYIKEKCYWMDWKYLMWYANHKFDPSQVLVENWHGQLRITIEGPVEEVTFWEIVVLRAVSCTYTALSGRMPHPDWLEKVVARARRYMENGVLYVEGGGRRPFSADVHWEALTSILPYRKTEETKGGLLGSSWAEYDYQLGLMPFGTQAHEYGMFLGGYYGHENANHMAMQIWVETYGKRLGYALPDTYTTEYFLKSFVFGYADIFSGVRNDSKEPYEFTEIFTNKKTGHWPKLGISTIDKSIVYSNGPEEDEAVFALNQYRLGEYIRSFLQGKLWTNNVGWRPYNMVAKQTEVQLPSGLWVHNVKISDNISKASGDPDEVEKVKQMVRNH